MELPIDDLESQKEMMAATVNPSIKRNDVLEIENLKVVFPTAKGEDIAVENLSIELEEGKILGLVGESGSGKSVTSLSILGLNDKAISSGSIRFRKKDGTVLDILKARERDLEEIRGSEIAMIFQEPGSALNPVLRIGKQLEKVIKLHDRNLSREERMEKAKELLRKAGLRDIERIYRMFPHELSGGMKQRVVIAMAISSNPTLILADEPTTALDETIQDEILELLETLVRENGVSMILISHNLEVISRMSDRIAIMRKGKLLEEGLKDEILENTIHPYTGKLLSMARNMEDMIHGNVPEMKEAEIPETCIDENGYAILSPTHRVLRSDR